MFPVLGKRFAVNTTMMDLSIISTNMALSLQHDQMQQQLQWLYSRLLSTPDTVLLSDNDNLRTDYLNDCIRLQVLRFLVKNITLPIQKPATCPEVPAVMTL